ncbi:diphthamide biosynthesis enzyme Dph2 [Methanolobus sp.]|uniref:diphthamide biosynthesis enzyme Dph2 n=1 Tax=Methanolobus sp. TaxID=1874737 RepID=UPI0025CCD901|nr:diphthamide biosynthesis enzyme Dph2 [Methanolobus sp.]
MSEGEAFDFQIDRIITIVKDTGAKVIGLQFPEGFKRRSPGIGSKIEDETGVTVLISGNPCFGACDIDVALVDNVEVLFHFGHAPLDDNALSRKVYFIETRSDVDVKAVVELAVPELKGQKIGLITTVQHVHKLKDASLVLKEHGKDCVICTGDSKIAYPGQVLGCNFSAARNEDCDEYLYIGSGQFHPLGVSLATKKHVLIADPFVNELREADSSKVLRQRSAVIAKSLDAESFGIVVSSKPGQERMKLAEELKKMAKKHGKDAYILTMDLVTPDQLLQFKMDAFVNTACPRIAVDEVGRFNAPMLTPLEFEIVLGEREWEDLYFDEIAGE